MGPKNQKEKEVVDISPSPSFPQFWATPAVLKTYSCLYVQRSLLGVLADPVWYWIKLGLISSRPLDLYNLFSPIEVILLIKS